MVTALREQKVSSLFFPESHFIANNIEVENFDHMQALLGGDCIAIALPYDILLWHHAQIGENNAKHTLTIQQGPQHKEIFGNCILTSNDDYCLSGIRSLSDSQRQWLGQHHSLMESEISGEYVFKFITNY